MSSNNDNSSKIIAIAISFLLTFTLFSVSHVKSAYAEESSSVNMWKYSWVYGEWTDPETLSNTQRGSFVASSRVFNYDGNRQTCSFYFTNNFTDEQIITFGAKVWESEYSVFGNISNASTVTVGVGETVRISWTIPEDWVEGDIYYWYINGNKTYDFSFLNEISMTQLEYGTEATDYVAPDFSSSGSSDTTIVNVDMSETNSILTAIDGRLSAFDNYVIAVCAMLGFIAGFMVFNVFRRLE